MSPNKDETAVHGCHYPGNMAVRMRKVLAIAFRLFILLYWGGGGGRGKDFTPDFRT